MRGGAHLGSHPLEDAVPHTPPLKGGSMMAIPGHRPRRRPGRPTGRWRPPGAGHRGGGGGDGGHGIQGSDGGDGRRMGQPMQFSVSVVGGKELFQGRPPTLARSRTLRCPGRGWHPGGVGTEAVAALEVPAPAVPVVPVAAPRAQAVRIGKTGRRPHRWDGGPVGEGGWADGLTGARGSTNKNIHKSWQISGGEK